MSLFRRLSTQSTRPKISKFLLKMNCPQYLFEPTRITQVFQNLLSNAVKYMDKPQGLVRIGCSDEGDI